ncbi:MAG: DUF418 domain-containing protein [Bacteroidetes bacterium]|nr:DUF418 domain-containing protein [Bacteroidota bacterium]
MSEASGTEPNKASSTEPSNAASKASGKAAKNKQKIVGLNVARAFAIIGMIIVNFKIVIGSEGPGWLQAVADVFSGKAAATFVVLAGLGLSLMAKSAQGDPLKKRKVQWKVFKRALFLFVIGLSYYFIWPADILHYYGLYMLLGLALLFRPPSYSFRIALVLIILFPILLFNFNYETGWNFESLEYLDFWTVEGFFRNLFYNGFHPFIPWAAFLLIGIWLGHKDLYDETFIIALLQRGLALFVTMQVLSPFAIKQAILVLGFSPESAEMVFGTASMPPNFMYMLNGIGIAFTVISLSILWAWRKKDSALIKALDRTGRMALTFYVLHVLVGMSIPSLISDIALGEFSIYFTLPYALGFAILCILLANWYLGKWKQGPLEWLLRKIA